MLIGASIMAYSDDVLRYNSYGKEYEVPRRRVFNLSELQRADHIAFYRLQGIYCHHAIVKHVDEESGEIKTIEYSRTPSGKFQVMSSLSCSAFMSHTDISKSSSRPSIMLNCRSPKRSHRTFAGGGEG